MPTVRPHWCSNTLRIVAVILIAICVALTVGHGLALAAPTRRPLTADERTRLSRGELVTRPLIERRGSLRLVGGSSWQVIDAVPSVVWQAVLDTQRYHRMLPRVKFARVVNETPQQRTVFVRHEVGVVDISYFLKLKTYRDRHDVTFVLDETRPHDIRAAWGFYSVRPYGNGRTLLSYGTMIDAGDGLIATLSRGQVRAWSLNVPHMVKRFVEGSGRWIYRPAE
jgi:hypothetical protein